MENLLVVSVLPENDPTAQAAIQTLDDSAIDAQVIRRTFTPAWAATPADW